NVTDNVAPPTVGTLTAGLFGEAAINLSAIPGVFSANTCKAFGSEFVKSRSSSSFDAELKDFIAPGPIHVSNCGATEVKQHWVGTAGNASLAIGSAGPGSANVATGTANGADGDTGTSTVDTGTYYVSEAFDANLYTKSLACFNDANNNGVNDAGDSAVTVGANDSVAVGSGQHV